MSARHRKSPATLLCRYLESLPYIDISTCRHFEVGEEKGANADVGVDVAVAVDAFAIAEKAQKGIGRENEIYVPRKIPKILQPPNPPTPKTQNTTEPQGPCRSLHTSAAQRFSGSAVQQGDETKLPNAGRIHVTDIQMEKKK